MDEEYRARLSEREAKFWWHVETDTPPENPCEEIVEIALDDMREVSMEGNNEWAALADDWINTRSAAAAFTRTSKELKTLVGQDVKLAIGHGIKATRSRAGAITIKEMV